MRRHVISTEIQKNILQLISAPSAKDKGLLNAEVRVVPPKAQGPSDDEAEGVQESEQAEECYLTLSSGQGYGNKEHTASTVAYMAYIGLGSSPFPHL